jgi:dTDP-4-amino-4,6-dideoxygalactose transaminase
MAGGSLQMNRIKFGEIQITETAKAHLQDCLNTNHVTMGPKTALVEQKWSDLFGYKHTIAVSSGTSACIAANMSLYDFGAKPGDEVIVPALSFIATANSVRAAGFIPVFVDVKDDLLIDETLIQAAITDKTVAIMPVSLMGKPPKMDAIKEIAVENNLIVILDNCEGHGCKYHDQFMGEWADVVVYSAYAAHIYFAAEQGLVSTNNPVIAEAVESIRSHGRKPKTLYFDHLRFGLNLKPTDLNSSIGLGSIEEFWDTMDKRKHNWNYLHKNLCRLHEYFWMSDQDYYGYTSPHGFSFTVKPNAGVSSAGLSKAFDDANIDWKRNFGCMATQHKCFEYLGYKLGDFPKAEYIGENGIHVGVHQFLSQDDLNRIVETVDSYVFNAIN